MSEKYCLVLECVDQCVNVDWQPVWLKILFTVSSFLAVVTVIGVAGLVGLQSWKKASYHWSFGMCHYNAGKSPWIGNTCASDPGPSSLSRTCSRPPGHTEPCKRSCPQRRSSPRPKCSDVPSGRCNSGGRMGGAGGAWVGGRVLGNQCNVGFTWHAYLITAFS